VHIGVGANWELAGH